MEQLASSLQAQHISDGRSSLKRPPESVLNPSVQRVKNIPQNDTDLKALLADKRRGPHRKNKQVNKWSPEEDQMLRDAVERHGAKNWKTVAQHVPNRDHTQCLQRWSKCLVPGLKKGAWTPEEDAMLTQCLKFQLGDTSRGPNLGGFKVQWNEVSKNIEGRTAKQCRERWINNLDPAINKGPWTKEEDERMKDLFKKYGPTWSAIAKEMPGRTENGVKIRWKTIAKTKDGMAVAAAAPKKAKAQVRAKAAQSESDEEDEEDSSVSGSEDESDENEGDNPQEQQRSYDNKHMPPAVRQLSSALDMATGSALGYAGAYYMQPTFPPHPQSMNMMQSLYYPNGASPYLAHPFYGGVPPPPARTDGMGSLSGLSGSGGMNERGEVMSQGSLEDAMRLLARGSTSSGLSGGPILNPYSDLGLFPPQERARPRTDSGQSGWSDHILVGTRMTRRDEDTASQGSNGSIGSWTSASGMAGRSNRGQTNSPSLHAMGSFSSKSSRPAPLVPGANLSGMQQFSSGPINNGNPSYLPMQSVQQNSGLSQNSGIAIGPGLWHHTLGATQGQASFPYAFSNGLAPIFSGYSPPSAPPVEFFAMTVPKDGKS